MDTIVENTTQAARRGNIVAVITEQPAPKAIRFRYECEGRSAGSIPGVNSTTGKKTFPTIKVEGYKGNAVVVVSCVTKDHPYRPHPHNIVGKESKKGVCSLPFDTETMTVQFNNLGIQCVKKSDIDGSLRVREEIRVDPFRTKFDHRKSISTIDLNSIRLCFQVFLKIDEKTIPLLPIVSDPIFDKKSMTDLVICKLSHCASSVAGGLEAIMLVEKVVKEDISIRFYEEHNGDVVWEGMADFPHTNVHKQVAISFKTPKYKTKDIEKPVEVFVQLKRPSDGCLSVPLPFTFFPLDNDPVLKRKRPNKENNIEMVKKLAKRDASKNLASASKPNLPALNTNYRDSLIDSQIKDESSDLPSPLLPHAYQQSIPNQQSYDDAMNGVDMNMMMFNQQFSAPATQPQPGMESQQLQGAVGGISYHQQQDNHYMHLQDFYNANAKASERAFVDANSRRTTPQNLGDQYHPTQTLEENDQFQPSILNHIPSTVHPTDHPNWSSDTKRMPFNQVDGTSNITSNVRPNLNQNLNHKSIPPSKYNIPSQQQIPYWTGAHPDAVFSNLPNISMNNFNNYRKDTNLARPTEQRNPNNYNNTTPMENAVDSHELFMMQMNSEELVNMALPLVSGYHNAAAEKSQQSETKIEEELDNMTDSFTRLSANTINELNHFHTMYNYDGSHPQQC